MVYQPLWNVQLEERKQCSKSNIKATLYHVGQQHEVNEPVHKKDGLSIGRLLGASS
jgi:hypothetical protein